MTALIPQRLGDFELMEELGRGGMGVVYKARQRSLDRMVALKVLTSALGLTPLAVERFSREAHAAAKLHHTNIVPVYATGEQAGVHYYAMELIAGPSLDLVIKQLRQHISDSERPTAPGPDLAATGPYVAPAPTDSGATTSSSLGSGDAYFDQVARRIAEVADALEHAHKQGVVHRDVKPSNLLLSPEGRLSLNDFGLARVLEQPGMTTTGEFVGTPAYMSPEQITSGRVPVDHRTDVYSLGATLYELLTLQAPFTGDSRDRVLTQILHKDPTPPRTLNKLVPRDLETICLKALQKDPDRRYQSAGEMADDLRRYVNRFAILARRPSVLERCGKWVRRHPGLTAGLACALVALTAAGYFAWVASVEEQRRKEEARQHAVEKALLAATSGDLDAADQAIAEAERLDASPGQVRMLHGQVALHRGRTNEAIRHLERAVELNPDSVAALGMLCVAYAYDGQWARFNERLRELLPLTPATPLDFLFKGYAVGQHDPRAGLQLIEKAIGDRPTIAHLYRADMQVWHAQNSGTREDAEQAMQEADQVKKSFRGNPVAIWISLYARLIVAGFYDRAGRKDEYENVMEQAGKDAEALKAFRLLPDAVVFRWLYYRERKGRMSDAPDLIADLLTAAQQTEHVNARYYHALTLYREGLPEKARKAIEGHHHDTVDQLRLFLLIDEGRDEEARDAHADFLRRYKDGWNQMDGQTFRRVRGGRAGKADASALCAQIPDDSFAPLLRTHLLRCRDYNAGKLGESEFEKSVNGSLYNECMTYYYIAMNRLAGGDRDGAIKAFQKVVATRAYFFGAYDMSWVFLRRLEEEPNWPRWVNGQSALGP